MKNLFKMGKQYYGIIPFVILIIVLFSKCKSDPQPIYEHTYEIEVDFVDKSIDTLTIKFNDCRDFPVKFVLTSDGCVHYEKTRDLENCEWTRWMIPCCYVKHYEILKENIILTHR